MPENAQNVTPTKKESLKRKLDLKKVAKTAGAASAVLLVAVGAYKLGASGDPDAGNARPVDEPPTPAE